MRAEDTTKSDCLVVRDEFPGTVDAASAFARLSQRGTAEGSVLLESGDLAPNYAERSYCVYKPSVCIQGKGDHFEIRALDRRGRAFLPGIGARLPESAVIEQQDADRIGGVIRVDRSIASFQARLAGHRPVDVLRAAFSDWPVPSGRQPQRCRTVWMFRLRLRPTVRRHTAAGRRRAARPRLRVLLFNAIVRCGSHQADHFAPFGYPTGTS